MRRWWLAAIFSSSMTAQVIQSDSEAMPRDLVFRATTALVQLDAVVTDRRGKQISDLKCSEFRLFQDGQRRDPVACTYIGSPEASGSRGDAATARISRELPRIAILIDELSMTKEAFAGLRYALNRYFEHHTGGDIQYAVFVGHGSLRIVREFTTNVAEIRDAVAKLRWGASVGADAPPADRVAIKPGTCGVIQRACHLLDTWHGRKILLLFSSFFRIEDTSRVERADLRGAALSEYFMQVRKAQDEAVDVANQSGISIYTIDPNGLSSYAGMGEAQGSQPNFHKIVTSDMVQNGLRYLSEQTGGTFDGDNNIGTALSTVAGEARGYYIIYYKPAFQDDTGGSTFHHVRLEIERRGAHARYRSEFLVPR